MMKVCICMMKVCICVKKVCICIKNMSFWVINNKNSRRINKIRRLIKINYFLPDYFALTDII